MPPRGGCSRRRSTEHLRGPRPRWFEDTRVTLGALLEILLMIGNVGTAVVMFPILRRYSETLSLSYVASRTIESTIIGVGAISLLRRHSARGPGRVDRRGRNLAGDCAVLFGAYEQDGLHALFSVPEGAFEAAFAIYLIVKGFRPSPILAGASTP